eukprot:715064-Pleurochrysis_carterae.AAC.1
MAVTSAPSVHSSDASVELASPSPAKAMSTRARALCAAPTSSVAAVPSPPAAGGARASVSSIAMARVPSALSSPVSSSGMPELPPRRLVPRCAIPAVPSRVSRAPSSFLLAGGGGNTSLSGSITVQ